MQAHPEHIAIPSSESLQIRQYELNSLKTPLHFHPECELVWIKRGRGTVFIADEIMEFKPGQLFLIGANLSHLFVSDAKEEDNNKFELVVVHITTELPASKDNFLPELNDIRQFIATRELFCIYELAEMTETAVVLRQIQNETGLRRLLSIIRLLDDLLRYQLKFQIKTGQCENFQKEYSIRMQHALRYIHDNYLNDISLSDASRHASMNKSAFCRSFKLITRRTFSVYINELRIEHACKLLVLKNMPIEQIAFDVGYSNASYFNRQFLKLKQVSPGKYRQDFNALNID